MRIPRVWFERAFQCWWAICGVDLWTGSIRRLKLGSAACDLAVQDIRQNVVVLYYVHSLRWTDRMISWRLQSVRMLSLGQCCTLLRLWGRWENYCPFERQLKIWAELRAIIQSDAIPHQGSLQGQVHPCVHVLKDSYADKSLSRIVLALLISRCPHLTVPALLQSAWGVLCCRRPILGHGSANSIQSPVTDTTADAKPPRKSFWCQWPLVSLPSASIYRLAGRPKFHLRPAAQTTWRLTL